MNSLLVIVALSVNACSTQRVDPLQPVDLSIPVARSCKEADHYFGKALPPVDPGVLRELSRVLERLGEPALSCERAAFDEEYRLLERFPGPPLSVSIWRRGDRYGATVVTTTTDAAGSLRSRDRSDKTISSQQWQQFIAAADEFNLWFVSPLGPLGPPVQLRMVNEPGPSWMIEGHKNGRYHATIRPDADAAAFRQFRRAFYAAVDQPPPFEFSER